MGEDLIFVSHKAEETRALGASLALCLEAGDFIALDGDLAAGKTCLVQGLAAGLGYPGQATSPTFSLLHLYEGGRLPLYHFDVYRLSAPEEIENLGYEEFFYGGGICVVEWSERIRAYLPGYRLGIVMEGKEESRRIQVSFFGWEDVRRQKIRLESV